MTWQSRSSTAQPEGRFRIVDNVIATEQADTTILLNLRSGRYYTLNPVSRFIWRALASGTSTEGIVTLLCTEFDATDEEVTKDVHEFFERLLAEKLVRRDS